MKIRSLPNAQLDVYRVGQIMYPEHNFFALSFVGDLSRLRPQGVHKDIGRLNTALSTPFGG